MDTSKDQGGKAIRAGRGGRVAVGFAFCAIVLMACGLRLLLYGDPRLAVATTDTQSYIDSSRAPLLSAESFSGRRLFTTNLLYRAIGGGTDCVQIATSMPAVGEEADREIRPCFANIARLQVWLSMAGWIWLAFVVFRHLKEPLAKLLSAIIILLFAITPQIAGWDSILTSESMTLSLFAASFGFLIEIAFALTPQRPSKGRLAALSILWLMLFALWLFVRDANLYAIPATLVLSIPLLLLREFHWKRGLLIAVLLLIGLFVLGLRTSTLSPRWQPSVQHSLSTFIDPYPGRVQLFEERFGMPEVGSAGYESWFESRAPSAFSTFLVSHPGFIFTTIMENWPVFTHSYEQPYYATSSTKTASPLSHIGELMHPGSGVFYLVDSLLLIALCAEALAARGRDDLAWAWVLAWLYLVAAITLLLSYFGDTDGVMRHIFPSLEMFRLLMWVSLLIMMDTYLQPPARVAPSTTTATAGENAGGAAADGPGRMIGRPRGIAPRDHRNGGREGRVGGARSG